VKQGTISVAGEIELFPQSRLGSAPPCDRNGFGRTEIDDFMFGQARWQEPWP
jgi:hypothetical protein